MNNSVEFNKKFHVLSDEDQDNLYVDLGDSNSLEVKAAQVLEVIPSNMMKDIPQIFDDKPDEEKNMNPNLQVNMPILDNMNPINMDNNEYKSDSECSGSYVSSSIKDNTSRCPPKVGVLEEAFIPMVELPGPTRNQPCLND